MARFVPGVLHWFAVLREMGEHLTIARCFGFPAFPLIGRGRRDQLKAAVAVIKGLVVPTLAFVPVVVLFVVRHPKGRKDTAFLAMNPPNGLNFARLGSVVVVSGRTPA